MFFIWTLKHFQCSFQWCITCILSEIFFYCYGNLWRHITWLKYKKNWHLCFFSALICKGKESTKHLLVTSLIARKSLRIHTNRSRTELVELAWFFKCNCLMSLFLFTSCYNVMSSLKVTSATKLLLFVIK